MLFYAFTYFRTATFIIRIAITYILIKRFMLQHAYVFKFTFIYIFNSVITGNNMEAETAFNILTQTISISLYAFLKLFIFWKITLFIYLNVINIIIFCISRLDNTEIFKLRFNKNSKVLSFCIFIKIPLICRVSFFFFC